MREVNKVKLAIPPTSAISENKDTIAGNDLTGLKESDVANGQVLDVDDALDSGANNLDTLRVRNCRSFCQSLTEPTVAFEN